MDITAYLAEIRDLYRTGQSTEHSFRPALAKLFASIDPTLTVINEPKHITDVGAPDFVFQRDGVAIGWCEAKDIGKDVRKFAANDYSKAQKDRYRKGLPNLIYTNGLDFEFIRDGEQEAFVSIAELAPGVPAKPDAFATLRARLAEFAHATPLSVTSSQRLAELMAGKAVLMKDIMGNALVADMKAREAGQPATDLIGQYEAFKANLINDITVADFADIYAETIAYGLFAARLHDETPKTFSRAEALELLPKSNPFLRELFIYIAGPNLDDRLRRTVDDLCAVFLATDMDKVLRNFGKVTKRQDPFLHFYEDFLAEYNPAKRKARGVPPSPEVFRTISERGEALRRLHLMEDAAIGDTPYPFHGEAAEGEDCVVDKPRFEPQPDGTGRVYINGKGDEGQYFEAVPSVSWGFPIGGYQPAQKWLKDRKGRALSWDDIRHYQKIIKILAETNRIMAGIEMQLGETAEV